MPPKSSGIKSYRYLCSRVIWKYKRISVATEEKSVSNPISSQNWTEADCLGKSRAHLPSNRLYRPIPRNPPSLAQAPHQRKCQQTEKVATFGWTAVTLRTKSLMFKILQSPQMQQHLHFELLGTKSIFSVAFWLQ